MKNFKPYLWLIFAGALVLIMIPLCFLVEYASEGAWYSPLFNNYGGNLTAEILGGILFLLLALWFGEATEEKINRIHDAALKSEQVLAERERQLKEERDKDHFKQFMERESYHDVRFPNLKDSEDDVFGLCYTIEPARDKNGQPVKRETEMDSDYVVKVRGPAHIYVLSPDKIKAYSKSVIRDNEYYYCRFFNGSWQMSTDDVFSGWQPFYLSGKVGPAQIINSANEFMRSFKDPFSNLTLIGTLYLNQYGTVEKNGGGCTDYRVYRDHAGSIYLGISHSLPKRMYETDLQSRAAGWRFVIEDIRGYLNGAALINAKKEIKDLLAQHKIHIPQVHWYNVPETQSGIYFQDD